MARALLRHLGDSGRRLRMAKVASGAARQAIVLSEEGAIMAMIRWTPGLTAPVRDLVTMQEDMNRLFESVFGRTGSRPALDFVPVVDVEETPESFVFKADLPGVSPQDVKVHLMGDTVTIRGERRQQNTSNDANVLRSERTHGSFERSFTLGAPVRGDQVKASFKDGVLEVRVPKAEEARLREIEIKVGS